MRGRPKKLKGGFTTTCLMIPGKDMEVWSKVCEISERENRPVYEFVFEALRDHIHVKLDGNPQPPLLSTKPLIDKYVLTIAKRRAEQFLKRKNKVEEPYRSELREKTLKYIGKVVRPDKKLLDLTKRVVDEC